VIVLLLYVCFWQDGRGRFGLLSYRSWFHWRRLCHVSDRLHHHFVCQIQFPCISQSL